MHNFIIFNTIGSLPRGHFIYNKITENQLDAKLSVFGADE